MQYLADIFSGVTEKLFNSGLGWVVSITLGAVVVYLFKLILAVYKEKDSLQENRRQDMIEVNNKQTEVLTNFSQTMNSVLAKLSSGSK